MQCSSSWNLGLFSSLRNKVLGEEALTLEVKEKLEKETGFLYSFFPFTVYIDLFLRTLFPACFSKETLRPILMNFVQTPWCFVIWLDFNKLFFIWIAINSSQYIKKTKQTTTFFYLWNRISSCSFSPWIIQIIR